MYIHTHAHTHIPLLCVFLHHRGYPLHQLGNRNGLVIFDSVILSNEACSLHQKSARERVSPHTVIWWQNKHKKIDRNCKFESTTNLLLVRSELQLVTHQLGKIMPLFSMYAIFHMLKCSAHTFLVDYALRPTFALTIPSNFEAQDWFRSWVGWPTPRWQRCWWCPPFASRCFMTPSSEMDTSWQIRHCYHITPRMQHKIHWNFIL